MVVSVLRAQSPEELEAVYRFRYDVYVEELGRYRGVADHERRLLIEPEDAYSSQYVAIEDGAVVGCLRLTVGADGLSERHVRQYLLQPFLDEIKPDLLAIGERIMVAPRLRGSGAVTELMAASGVELVERGALLLFGDCEPHLLPLYLSMGCHPYADRNINSEEAGYLIPLVSFVRDPADVYTGALPTCLQRIERTSAITSAVSTPQDQYWHLLNAALEQFAQDPVHAFTSLDDDEVRRCIAKSTIIECAEGDRVLKKGGSAHNLFVVLDGTLEVRDGDRLVNVLTSGEVFGEMAFLLNLPRQRDVYAVAPGTRVLSLSEGSLRAIIADNPAAAAKLLLNISKMLCLRLIKT